MGWKCLSVHQGFFLFAEIRRCSKALGKIAVAECCNGEQKAFSLLILSYLPNPAIAPFFPPSFDEKFCPSCTPVMAVPSLWCKQRCHERVKE